MRNYKAWNKGLTAQTDERVKKYSVSHNGLIPWNKGLTKNTDPRLKKFSNLRKQINYLPQKPRLNKKWPENVKNKISKSLMGNIPWNKGKKGLQVSSKKGWHLSEETKRKISIARRKQKGINSPNWKGGLSSFRDLIETSTKYKEWRQNCFIRDNFTCQKCGQKGGDLNVHHKKSFLRLVKEAIEYLPLFKPFEAVIFYSPLWDLNNGITLCIKCHRNIYKKILKK